MNNDTSFDIIQDSNPVQTVAPTNKEDNDIAGIKNWFNEFLPKMPVAKSVRSTRQRENEASD